MQVQFVKKYSEQLEDDPLSVLAPDWLSGCLECAARLSGAQQIAVGLVAMCEDGSSEVNGVPVPAEGGLRQRAASAVFLFSSSSYQKSKQRSVDFSPLEKVWFWLWRHTPWV